MNKIIFKICFLSSLFTINALNGMNFDFDLNNNEILSFSAIAHSVMANPAENLQAIYQEPMVQVAAGAAGSWLFGVNPVLGAASVMATQIARDQGNRALVAAPIVANEFAARGAVLAADAYRAAEPVVRQNLAQVLPEARRLAGVGYQEILQQAAVARPAIEAELARVLPAMGQAARGAYQNIQANAHNARPIIEQEMGAAWGAFQGDARRAGGAVGNLVREGLHNAVQISAGAAAQAIEIVGQASADVGWKFAAVSAGLATISVAGYFGREAAVKYVKKYLFQPALVAKHSSGGWTSYAHSLFFSQKPLNLSNYMVVSDELAERLEYLSKTTRTVKKHGGEFEHVLLHGLPGTGKTYFAEVLAQNCGMDYAFVPAANISQFFADGTAVEELNKLFEWANKSSRGTIIFFDEAEAFLGNRENLAPAAYHALTKFLELTGTPTNKIMIICATNRPEALDKAVRSRLGNKIYFALPDAKARYEQLIMHRNKAFAKSWWNTHVNSDRLHDTACLNNIAQKTNGFSGRTLQKMVNGMRQMSLGDETFIVTDSIIKKAIKQYADEDKLIH